MCLTSTDLNWGRFYPTRDGALSGDICECHSWGGGCISCLPVGRDQGGCSTLHSAQQNLPNRDHQTPQPTAPLTARRPAGAPQPSPLLTSLWCAVPQPIGLDVCFPKTPTVTQMFTEVEGNKLFCLVHIVAAPPRPQIHYKFKVQLLFLQHCLEMACNL